MTNELQTTQSEDALNAFATLSELSKRLQLKLGKCFGPTYLSNMRKFYLWRTKEDKVQGNNALIIVECKAEKVTIHEEDYFQGYNYASWAGADFFVTTNLKETRIFKVVKGKMPKRLEEIVDIPDAETAKSPKGIEKLLNQTKAFTREEFSRVLLKCHNIIRNNDKLSPEAAFDEISKILFIKIRYERDADEGQIFSFERFQRLKSNREVFYNA